jgi:hypothetical protein
MSVGNAFRTSVALYVIKPRPTASTFQELVNSHPAAVGQKIILTNLCWIEKDFKLQQYSCKTNQPTVRTL